MTYALGLTNTGCGCSSSSSATTSHPDHLAKSGMFPKDALDTDMILDQGITSEMLLCFTGGELSPEVKCIKQDGTLVFSGSETLCFRANDLIRMINFDPCRQDGSEIYQIVANPAYVNDTWEVKLQAAPADAAAGTPAGKPFTDALTAANLIYTDGQYCFSQVAAKTPIGCVSTVKPGTPAPRLMLHRPATNLIISGAVSYRDDLHLELGVTADGTDWLTASAAITGRVKVGDYLSSPDNGINNPLRILQVRTVEVNKDDGTGTELIERWQVESKVTSNNCMLAYIRRGTTMNFETIADNGCVRVIIPGSMSSGLQLVDDWRDDSDGTYYIGRYTITATWAVLRNGILAPRSDVIKAGKVYVRPTHHFSVKI